MLVLTSIAELPLNITGLGTFVYATWISDQPVYLTNRDLGWNVNRSGGWVRRDRIPHCAIVGIGSFQSHPRSPYWPKVYGDQENA